MQENNMMKLTNTSLQDILENYLLGSQVSLWVGEKQRDVLFGCP